MMGKHEVTSPHALKVLVGVVSALFVGSVQSQFLSGPLTEPTFSASPVKVVPKISTFGVPIGDSTQERLNEPVAVQRVRCGQEDACFRGNEPDAELSQDDLVRSRQIDPQPVDDGLYASLSLGYTHHDNIERSPEDEEESDNGLGIGLGLLYRNRWDRLSYQLGLQSSAVAFDDNDNNDFDSYSLTAGLLYELTEIIDLGLHAGYSERSEERNASGSRLVETGQDADDVETKIIGGQITVGRPQSRFQFVLAGSHAEDDFTLNSDLANQSFQDIRDRDYDHISATVFYNTEGPVRYFLEANYTEIDYDNDTVRRLDSDETGYYVGALWSISAITSADFRIGRLEKDFDDPLVDDPEETSYSARLRWQPTHRTAFTFYGSKRFEETTELTSDYFDSQVLGVNFAYQLIPQKLDLIAYYNYIEDEFSSGRDDETDDYGIGFVYHARRWMSVGFRYGRSERDSNVADAEFDDNFFDVFIQLNGANSYKLL